MIEVNCRECNEPLDLLSAKIFFEDHYSTEKGTTFTPVFFCDLDCIQTSANYFVCADCGRIEYRYDGAITHDGREVCVRCAENYYRCTDCCELYPENMGQWADDDSWYCYDCLPVVAINSYSYRPQPIFDGSQDFGPFIGVELEVDKVEADCDRQQAAADVIDACCGRIYCKHDSSVSRGYEMVSHPATLDRHIASGIWAQAADISRKHGFRSHDTSTAGLHTHISRDFFGDPYTDKQAASFYRLMILFQNLQGDLCKFARRRSDRWAAFSSYEYKDKDKPAADKGRDVLDLETDRYCALNFCNRHTVEIRIFRGSLNIETIRATLAFVDGVARAAKNWTTDAAERATWTDLRKFISATCSDKTAKDAFNAYCKRRCIY